METDIDEGLRGARTNSSDIIATSAEGGINWDKAFFSAAGLEGKSGKGIGKTNANAPVILPFPSNQPYPPKNTPAQSSAPPVKYHMIHPTTHLPMLKSCYESPRPRYIKGFSWPEDSTGGRFLLEGKKSQSRAIAANIDVGTYSDGRIMRRQVIGT